MSSSKRAQSLDNIKKKMKSKECQYKKEKEYEKLR